MKANFIHYNLNCCGGADRFALVSVQAVLEMGIDIDLVTLEAPNINKLENAFGKDLAEVIKKLKKLMCCIDLINSVLMKPLTIRTI